MIILFYAFLALNFLAFLIIGYDKYLAVKNKWRIPEQTLLGFVLFGGTIGSGLGMLLFRHKTSKSSYLMKFYAIIAIQVLMVFGWIYFHWAKL